MTIYEMVTELCRPRQACSELFRQHRFEKRRSLYLAKTLTPMPDTPPDLLSQSLQNLGQEISLLHSEQSLLNTPETSDILVQLTVTSQSGLKKVSYYGTPFLVAELVSRFLMIGQTDVGTSSPEKSSGDVTTKESSSPSSALLPSVTFTKSRRRRSSKHPIPPQEDH